MADDFPEVMDMHTAARYLGYSYSHFKDRIADGIPSIQRASNAKRFFRKTKLDAWRTLHERPSAGNRRGGYGRQRSRAS